MKACTMLIPVKVISDVIVGYDSSVYTTIREGLGGGGVGSHI